MASSGTSPALRRILNRSTPGLDYSTEESAAGRQGAASPGPSTQPPRSASRMSNSVQMRSTAGRELVAWLAEDAAAAAGDQHPPTSTTAAAPLSSQSLNGRSSRMSLRHVFSPELPPPPRSETPKTPRYESETLKRRQQRTPLLAVDSHHHSSTATSWDHPVSPTPDHRLNNGTAVARRASGARSSLDIRDRADRRTSADLSNGTLTMRGNVDEMDKLEIYYKYTAVKAEFEKALDDLAITRNTLAEVRRERDGFEEELRKERALGNHLLGPDTYKFEEMARSRQTWEMRARDAADELDRVREEAAALRQELEERRDREEQLERETVMMGAKLVAAEANASPSTSSGRILSPRTGFTRNNISPRTTSPLIISPRVSSSRNMSISESPRSTSSPRISRRPGSAPLSPTLPASMVRSNSQKSESTTATSMARSNSQKSDAPTPPTPASRFSANHRTRTYSTPAALETLPQPSTPTGLGIGGSGLSGGSPMQVPPKSIYRTYNRSVEPRSPPGAADVRSISPTSSSRPPPSAMTTFSDDSVDPRSQGTSATSTSPPPPPPLPTSQPINEAFNGIPSTRRQVVRRRTPLSSPDHGRRSSLSAATTTTLGSPSSTSALTQVEQQLERRQWREQEQEQEQGEEDEEDETRSPPPAVYERDRSNSIATSVAESIPEEDETILRVGGR